MAREGLEGLNLTKTDVRVNLEEKAKFYWKNLHQEYQTILDEYHELLNKKRELNLPLRSINASTLREFPTQNLELLRATDEKEVEQLISEKTDEQLIYSIKKMKELKNNYVYRTLRAKVNDYRNEIRIRLSKGDISTLSRPGIVTTVACKRTSTNNG